MMGGCCGLGGFGGYGSLGWIGGILNLIITIGLVVGIVLLVIWMMRRFRSDERGFGSGRSSLVSEPSPQEILQARYARGEIDREQYQQMLSDLG